MILFSCNLVANRVETVEPMDRVERNSTILWTVWTTYYCMERVENVSAVSKSAALSIELRVQVLRLYTF